MIQFFILRRIFLLWVFILLIYFLLIFFIFFLVDLLFLFFIIILFLINMTRFNLHLWVFSLENRFNVFCYLLKCLLNSVIIVLSYLFKCANLACFNSKLTVEFTHLSYVFLEFGARFMNNFIIYGWQLNEFISKSFNVRNWIKSLMIYYFSLRIHFSSCLTLLKSLLFGW